MSENNNKKRVPEANYVDTIKRFLLEEPDMKALPLAKKILQFKEGIGVDPTTMANWIRNVRTGKTKAERRAEKLARKQSECQNPIQVDTTLAMIREMNAEVLAEPDTKTPILFQQQGELPVRDENVAKEQIKNECEKHYGSRNCVTFPDTSKVPSSEEVESGEASLYAASIQQEQDARRAWVQQQPLSGLNNTDKTYVVMGCMHMPYHNKAMFNAALKLMADLRSHGKLDGVILNGDILDMNSISRHGKNKVGVPGMTLEKEYQIASYELDKIDRAAGPCEKVYMYGNHEMWYFDFMADPNNFKLGGGAIMSPEAGLNLRERGYKVYRDYKTAYHMLGDLEVIHGDYVNVHAAHAHVQKMKRNVMFVHTHRMGSFFEGNLAGYNIGWGGDSTAPVFGYMTRVMKETWRNGFAVVTVDQYGFSHVTQIVWTNNSFYFRAKRYTA